jgi:hypothetical protein
VEFLYHAGKNIHVSFGLFTYSIWNNNVPFEK